MAVFCKKSEQEFSLCSALLEATKQGESQAEELKEKKLMLNSIQDTLSKIVQRCASVSNNIKQKEQQISGVTNEIEQLSKRNERLQTEMYVIQMENIKLRSSTEEQLECLHFSLSWYNTYHNKIESYKMSTAALESQATIHKEVIEKREEVKRSNKHVAELKINLQNPAGNSIQQAQKEIDNFKAQIQKTKQLVRRKEILLEEEKKKHSQLKKDIAIHNRKCEAIMKRLRCQLNKAQSSYEELKSAIFHMEKQVDNLKKQPGTSYIVD